MATRSETSGQWRNDARAAGGDQQRNPMRRPLGQQQPTVASNSQAPSRSEAGNWRRPADSGPTSYTAPPPVQRSSGAYVPPSARHQQNAPSSQNASSQQQDKSASGGGTGEKVGFRRGHSNFV